MEKRLSLGYPYRFKIKGWQGALLCLKKKINKSTAAVCLSSTYKRVVALGGCIFTRARTFPSLHDPLGKSGIFVVQFAPCKGIRIPESGKFWLVESGIQLKESGIPLTIRIQNPTSTVRIQYLESGIHGVEFRIQDCLGFPYT